MTAFEDSPTFDFDRSVHVLPAFAEPSAFDWSVWRARRAFKETYFHLGNEALKQPGTATIWLMAHGLAVVSVAVVLMLPLAIVGR